MYPRNFIELSDKLVEEGRDRFNFTLGIVSHIENERYKLVSVSSSTGVFVSGESFLLSDTYCREVVEKKATVHLTEFNGKKQLKGHPLYKYMPLEAYISCPIFFDDTVWGTLNFSCVEMPSKDFLQEDIEFIEASAQALSHLLSN